MIERIPFLGRLFLQPSGSEKKTIFLHIGMGKTGTTALQEFFWANSKNLAERGIAYPSHGAVSHAHHLLSPHRPPFLTGSWRFEDAAEWAPVIDRLGGGKVLLSSELIAWSKPEIVTEFCAELKQWFDVRVVVYVRRQDDLIMAGYNQQIKAGTQRREIHDIVESQFQRFDYSAKLRPWEEALGKDAIILRPYERTQFHEGDIRFDFLHHVFGIDGFTEFELPSGNSNPRLSYGAMEFKRLINNVFPDTNESSRFNPLLLDYSAESDASSTSIYAKQSLLSPGERVDILKRFEAINSALAQEYLGRADGKLFLSAWPDIEESWVAPRVEDKDLSGIVEFIRRRDPSLARMLVERIERSRSASDLSERSAADRLAALLPGAMTDKA